MKRFTLSNLMTTGVITWVIGMLSAVAIGHIMGKTDTQPGEKILTGQPVKIIECEKLKTYPTKKSKKLAKVPKKIRKDRSMHLVDSIRIEDDGHDHIVSAIFAEKDYRVNQFNHTVPFPWLDTRKRLEIGAAYGVSDIETGWQFDGNYQFASTKGINWHIHGNVRQDESWFVGARFAKRFYLK
jgi:hypothetical protein